MDSKHREAIVADASLMAQVDAVAKQLSLSTRTKTLKTLIEFFEQSQRGSEALPIVTFENVMRGGETAAPICVVGKPSSGKSYTLTKFLQECSKRGIPFFLFVNEREDQYQFLPQEQVIDFPRFEGLFAVLQEENKKHADRPLGYRVNLPSSLEERSGKIFDLCRALFSKQRDDSLKPWVLVIEEGSSWAQRTGYLPVNEFFINVLNEMRKYCRRLITTSTTPGTFPMCREMRPIPFENKGA